MITNVFNYSSVAPVCRSQTSVQTGKVSSKVFLKKCTSTLRDNEREKSDYVSSFNSTTCDGQHTEQSASLFVLCQPQAFLILLCLRKNSARNGRGERHLKDTNAVCPALTKPGGFFRQFPYNSTVLLLLFALSIPVLVHA